MTTYPLYLAGYWKTTKKKAKIFNPHNKKHVTTVCLAEEEHVETALSEAEKAFSYMRKLSSFERSQILKKIKIGMAERRKELALSISSEMGKTLNESYSEVDRAYNTFEIAEEESKRMGGEILPLDLLPATIGRTGLSKRFPLGVIFCITPFNFPLNLAAHKIAPAFAVGNAVILKPPRECVRSSLILAEIIDKAGLPKGAFSVLPCDNDVAEKAALDNRVKLISFTGSSKVGWYLKSKARKQKVVLELGGVAHLIITEDADLKDAIQKCVNGAFSIAGQSCISTQCIFIHKNLYKKFLRDFVMRVHKIKVGDPLKKRSHMGPLISEEAAQRIETWVGEAKRKGARIECGGVRKKAFYWPTVLTGVKKNMKISCEEVFGPICVVEPYENFEAVLNRVNDTAYGLQAGLYSHDMNKIWKAYETIDVGGLIVNDTPTWRIDHMPYGGIKDSGLGREGLKYAMMEMTETKLLVLRKLT